MRDELELNAELLKVCGANVIDYNLVESLLKQGANPLGRITEGRFSNNLYEEVISTNLFANDETTEDFYKIAELFLKYGMDISKPSIPYDGSNVLNPLWMFGFFSNEVVLRTLKLLLDNGLSADDADECWGHAIFDLANIDGDLMTDFDYEVFNDYIRKLMLIASYPHVLNEDEYLRDEIWFQYNDYDVTKFRNWNNYAFDVDTSHCIGNPHVCGSVVTIIEKTTGKPVWKFGVCLKPEEIE